MKISDDDLKRVATAAAAASHAIEGEMSCCLCGQQGEWGVSSSAGMHIAFCKVCGAAVHAALEMRVSGDEEVKLLVAQGKVAVKKEDVTH